MLDCAEETLGACNIRDPVDVMGHSMGGFCSLALTLERGRRVRRLVLIGPPTGGVLGTLRSRGIPFIWPPWDLRFWQVCLWGIRLMRGGGNLAVHKRLFRFMQYPSFVDKSLLPRVTVEEGDQHRAAPVRMRWPNAIRGLDYRERLGKVRAPTLICVGRFDPQTPVACSEELARGIPGARLVIFERSGHSPFVEEPEQFATELVSFFGSA
ncbi:alpha/beta hydrolase, partial [Chloroflexota bacterium]